MIGLQKTERAERRLARRLRRRDRSRETAVDAADIPTRLEASPVDIAGADPLLAYVQSNPQPVDLARLELDSPAAEELRAAGVRMVVPLVAQGELIGMLNLGERLSEQDYSAADRKLLESLARQAAPSLRVAQLAREQATEVRLRERFEQEMRVAQLIQQNFLPERAPQLTGWSLDAYYQPAREVGGDFYDFVELDDGRLGIMVGDVTDKGMPAALVMASTRSVLRAAAQRVVEPGAVLERVNEQLQPDIPQNMFVTCLYGVLDPESGRFRFANAGHNLPCVQTGDGAVEVRATGMPLGLMPGMAYEECEVTIPPGRSMLLYSDALPEAHGPDGEMFGFPRVVETVGGSPGGSDLMDRVLEAMTEFTGEDWEEEDDITLVAVAHAGSAGARPSSAEDRDAGDLIRADRDGAAGNRADDERVLVTFTIPSETGREREVMERVAEAVSDVPLADGKLDRVRTAVAEAAMNAIEHGNAGRADLPVDVGAHIAGGELRIRVTDRRAGQGRPETGETPDLEAKLRGEQSPRGWGLFLIESMVDELRVAEDDERRTVELVMWIADEGGEDA